MTRHVLPVFYTPHQVADSGAYSPSAAKPAQLVDHWGAVGLPMVVHSFPPVTVEQLCAVHDPAYVRGVLDGTRENGFGNRRTDVILSLPYTTGSMLAAARHAIDHPRAPAPCSPTSGFHHAGRGHGAGFCTFNGLVVAAVALLDADRVDRVGILDADEHYGDGTEDCLEHLPEEVRDRIFHITVGEHFRHEHQAKDFLGRFLPSALDRIKAVGAGVVLYQAGQDPHVDDPLGGWLTTEQLAERDRIVFEGFRARHVPVAWNLAGGYRKRPDGTIPDVLAGHTNTALAALAACPASVRPVTVAP